MNVIINYDHCISGALQMQRSGVINYESLFSAAAERDVIINNEYLFFRSITNAAERKLPAKKNFKFQSLTQRTEKP